MSFLSNQQKSIVLTGEIGSGKTSLFNKICKEN
jgi:type IV secretory pathway ATPase VirB11/archaellum biosynthesis ATPase